MTHMRVCSITRSELPCTLGCEAALSVAAGAREAAGACSEDGSFARLQASGWDEEDELEFLEGAHGGRLGFEVAVRRIIDGGVRDGGLEVR